MLYEIKGHILQLSKEKYASNVIEKCLEQYDKAGMDEFLNEIIDKGGKRYFLIILSSNISSNSFEDHLF